MFDCSLMRIQSTINPRLELPLGGNPIWGVRVSCDPGIFWMVQEAPPSSLSLFSLLKPERLSVGQQADGRSYRAH